MLIILCSAVASCATPSISTNYLKDHTSDAENHAMSEMCWDYALKAPAARTKAKMLGGTWRMISQPVGEPVKVQLSTPGNILNPKHDLANWILHSQCMHLNGFRPK